jgi:hypothetical protein
MEGGDEVKSAWLGLLVEPAEIARDEAHVLVALPVCLDAGDFNGFFREVDSDELAVREPVSQQVQTLGPARNRRPGREY